MYLPEKEWYIKAPWGRICIIAWGDCQDPPVLLCHGGIDVAITFRPLIQHLPKNFYYIAMEFPGSGKSDRYPQGLMYSMYDFTYAIRVVVQHFRWDTFVCMGHSLGALVARIYNLSYPGSISKLIELDPINAIAVEPEHFAKWYNKFYVEFYKNYHKYNTPKEKAPKIKWKDAMENLCKNRGIPEGIASAILERMSEPAGDGMIRYTFDLRIKIITIPPLSKDHTRKLMTGQQTPTLMLCAEESLKQKYFRNTTFLLEEKNYPNGNFRMRTVSGRHDAHITNAGHVAAFVGQFLLYGLEGLDGKAKL